MKPNLKQLMRKTKRTMRRTSLNKETLVSNYVKRLKLDLTLKITHRPRIIWINKIPSQTMPVIEQNQNTVHRTLLKMISVIMVRLLTKSLNQTMKYMMLPRTVVLRKVKMKKQIILSKWKRLVRINKLTNSISSSKTN